jgi:hypothetical protein
MTPEQKAWIDAASYTDLFKKWRFAPVGDPFFQGECGKYFAEVMKKRRHEVGPDEHTRVSKAIGWAEEGG